MKAANSVGVLGVGSTPMARMRSLNSRFSSAVTKDWLSLPIISVGVPAGAMRPNHPIDSKPVRPALSKVGMNIGDPEGNMTGEQVGGNRSRSPIGHERDAYARHSIEQLRGHMHRHAVAP